MWSGNERRGLPSARPSTQSTSYQCYELQSRSCTDPMDSPRQRLLYLQARTPSPLSTIIGLTLIEPRKSYKPEITDPDPDWPYQTVHDALVDGWQIVQFPQQQAPFDDRELDVVGYEFILQKMEIVTDE